MTPKMWPLKCVRFIVLVWVSSRAGFSYKNARENPKTKLQFSFVPFKGTSNPSLFREMGTWRLMDRYKIFMWLQAVYCIPAHYFLHYPLSPIPACWSKWMAEGSEQTEILLGSKLLLRQVIPQITLFPSPEQEGCEGGIVLYKGCPWVILSPTLLLWCNLQGTLVFAVMPEGGL